MTLFSHRNVKVNEVPVDYNDSICNRWSRMVGGEVWGGDDSWIGEMVMTVMSGMLRP